MPPTFIYSRARGARRLAAAAVLALVVGCGSLAAVGHSTGLATRTIMLGSLPYAVALDASTGRAFVSNGGDGEATISVLNLANSRVVDMVAAGNGGILATQALAMDARLHRLAVISRGDDLYHSQVRLLDTRTGTLLRATNVGYAAQAVAVDERAGRIVVANAGDGSVSLLDARTGRLLHTSAVGAIPVSVAVDERAGRIVVVAVAAQGRGYEGGGGLVSLLDARMGRLLRQIALGGEPEMVAVDGRVGHAFVADTMGDRVSVIDTRTDAVLATTPVGLRPSALVVDEREGHVFVANEEDGTVSMLDAASGAVLRTIAVAPHPSALAVDERRGRIVVASVGPLAAYGIVRGHGSVCVLDAVTGAVRRSVAVGVGPRSLAVDERSGRIVVVNTGGAVQPSPGWLDQWLQRLPSWLRRPPRRAPATTVAPGSVSVITLPA